MNNNNNKWINEIKWKVIIIIIMIMYVIIIMCNNKMKWK